MKRVSYHFCVVLFLLTLSSSTFSQPIVNLLWEKIANVRSMQFSPNGQYLVTGGSTIECYPYTCGQIKVWRIADTALLRTITAFNIGLTNDIDFYSNGSKFITGHGSVYCAPKGGCSIDKAGQFQWDLGSGTSIASDLNQNGIFESVDISPDQSMIAAAISYNNVGEIRIYDSDYNLLRTLPGHAEGTTSLKFSPDGQTLVSGGHDGFVKVWNVSTGELIRSMFHGEYINGGWDIDIDISPSGQFIASAGQGYQPTVKIWTFAGALLHTFLVDDLDGYNKISFSPNGEYLADGSILYGLNGVGWYGLLSFWRVSDGQLVERYADYTGSPSSGGIWSIAFSNTADHYFAYSISNRLRVATVNINLVTATTINSISTNELSYHLYNNYPNPFNPKTIIRFDIPDVDHSSNHRITIYDAVGKTVQVLLDQKLSPGSYEVTFDGTNYSSGIYYYRFEADGFTDVKRMVMVK